MHNHILSFPNNVCHFVEFSAWKWVGAVYKPRRTVNMSSHALCTYYLAFSEHQGGESRGPQQYLLSSSSGHTLQQGHLAYWFQSPCPWLLSLIIPNNVQWGDAGAPLLVIFWSHLLMHSGEGSKDRASCAQPESFYANLQRQPHLHRAQPSLAKRHHEMRNLGSHFSLTQRYNSCRLLRQAETYSTASSERWESNCYFTVSSED